MKREDFLSYVVDDTNVVIFNSVAVHPELYDFVVIDGEKYIKFTEEVVYDCNLNRYYICATCGRPHRKSEIAGFDENDNYICYACRHDNYDLVEGNYVKHQPISEYEIYRIAHNY